jgi:TM2 domain-containing membrane protein YozV
MRDKATAAILAILLGSFGAHKFYLNSIIPGILYILFSWTFIPMILGIIEGIIILCKNDQEFDKKYNEVLKDSSSELESFLSK